MERKKEPLFQHEISRVHQKIQQFHDNHVNGLEMYRGQKHKWTHLLLCI